MDLIRNAMATLGGWMKGFATAPVVYASGNASVAVNATISPSEVTLDDGTIAVLSDEYRDFSITAADLILNGVQAVPQRGDSITAVIQGITYVFGVMLENRSNVWDWNDSSQVRRCIHTKKTSP